MDFFSYQDEYQRKSWILYLAFLGSVILAVCILYVVITVCIIPGHMLVSILGSQKGFTWLLPMSIYGSTPKFLAWEPFFKIGGSLALFILIVSTIRISAIKRGGGAYVAKMLGGVQLIQPHTEVEKKFLNVVEEMAVASGLPRPRLYILENEKGINAVTAGLDHEDAVIAVTRGALDHLNRDELQAIIAHEFAHIYNGDYALNMAMAGWLYGLLFFSVSGRKIIGFIEYGTEPGGFIDHFRREIYQRAMSLPVVLWGYTLWLGGLAGKFAADLMAAAFSRQREQLADAFAVQFTRNPQALAGALKKIAGLNLQGQLKCGQALTMSSFFIVSISKEGGWLSTHPPLEDRIELLDPNWDGRLPKLETPVHKNRAEPEPIPPFSTPSEQQNLKIKEKLQTKLLNGEITPEVWNIVIGSLADKAAIKSHSRTSTAQPVSPQSAPADHLSAYQHDLAFGSLAVTHDILDGLPESLRQGLSSLEEASALVMALFLNNDPEKRLRQLALIGHYTDERIAGKAASMAISITERLRLPLLSLAAPNLRLVQAEAKRGLLKAAESLIEQDGRMDMFEIAAGRLLRKYLFNKASAVKSSPASLYADIRTVLSFVATSGYDYSPSAFQSFTAGTTLFQAWPSMAPKMVADLTHASLAEALDRCSLLGEDLRRQLLLAAAVVISHDQLITTREYDILRSLAVALEMPLPYLTATEISAA